MKNKEKYNLKELKIKWIDHESMEIYADDGVLRMTSNSNAILLRGLVNWLEQKYQKPPILDGEERKYLSAVIKPWRDRVKSIIKAQYSEKEEFIGFDIGSRYICFPPFKKGTMYKGMELNKEYKLEDLKL